MPMRLLTGTNVIPKPEIHEKMLWPIAAEVSWVRQKENWDAKFRS